MSVSDPAQVKKAVSPVRTGVAYLSVKGIHPDPDNPRVHSRKQVRAIARSVETFGFNSPILVDSNNRIVAGHGHLEAAIFLGMEEVPVIRLEHLSEQQAKAYLLADNKLAELSSWDEGQLALQLKGLQESALDFDIEAIAFEHPEIDFLIQSLDAPDTADAADEFVHPDGPAVSVVGDLWELGTHRLICGNALDPSVYEALLGPETAQCVFTDPPFNVRVRRHAVGKGRTKHREFPMASGEMSQAQFQEFLLSSVRLIHPHVDAGAVCFMVMDWRHLVEAMTAGSQADFSVLNLCVWAKSNGGMGSLYRSAHELVIVFCKQGAQHRNNVQLGRFGRNRSNVWHYPGMNSFPRTGRERALDMHPTVKPIALVVDAILDVSKRGDIVLDPFCGSGTTILAAERTGRRGFGIELDPQYVDLSIKRWEKMTGHAARHVNGKSFAEISNERAH